MDNEEERKKKLPDDVPSFLRKRSETELPRYAATLRAYFELQRKKGRGAAAKRRPSDHGNERKISANRKKGDTEQKDKNAENSGGTPYSARRHCGMSGEHPAGEDDRISRRRGGDKSDVGRCRSRPRSLEPTDRCCRRRRRRSRSRRRRRRSCRRRRRRSCRRRRRRSCRRRRRRSCRRRRRRSCRRRRRRSCRRRRRRSCRRRRRRC